MNLRAPRLAAWLTTLTILFIAWQCLFFAIHYHVTELVDSMVNSTFLEAMHSDVIWKPILQFVGIQLAAWFVYVCWLWFISVACGEWLGMSSRAIMCLGVWFWCLAACALLGLNAYFFPNSFFAQLLATYPVLLKVNGIVTVAICAFLMLATVLAWLYSLFTLRHFFMMTLMTTLVGAMGWAYWHDRMSARGPAVHSASIMPNVIIIGLDSVRPDFTSYGGNEIVTTPHIDEFMRYSTAFTNNYTPLARTFPSWVSILTAKHPKHSEARNNLVNPEMITTQDTLAKRLQQAGYETIYATDEKRYSNITTDYGFDRVLGSKMGVNDFLLGTLTDFPLTNLLINLPGGRYLFPYNYGNRAAAVTYNPDTFLQQIKWGLAAREEKPLFLAVHLCLSHWPFSWADDEPRPGDLLFNHYQRSVQAVDDQFGKLMSLLEDKGLLHNAIVVLMSDHGTTLGLAGDRFVEKEHYKGDAADIKKLSVSRLTTAREDSLDVARDFTINTSYGQGTDLLSLKQYHTLLAFKRYGDSQTPQAVEATTSLLDIAPTILSELKLPPLDNVDGVSLSDYLKNKYVANIPRAFYMETGDSLTEIETDHIYMEKVLKKEINIYRLNPANGLIYLDTKAARSVAYNKQRSVMQGEWLLVRYPAKTRAKLVLEKGKTNYTYTTYEAAPYYVLANLRTGDWTIGENNDFAKNSPMSELKASLETFYKDEL